MITIHSNQNQVAYGIQHFIIDEIDDLNELNKKPSLKPGSTVFVIKTSKYYMLNGKNSWIEINPYGMGHSSNSGSGGSGDSDSPNDGIYDGGSIDGSDPV